MILVQFDVVCDGGCSKSAFEDNTIFFSADDAKLAAWQLGWLFVDGEHICPECMGMTQRRALTGSLVRQRELETAAVRDKDRQRRRRV